MNDWTHLDRHTVLEWRMKMALANAVRTAIQQTETVVARSLRDAEAARELLDTIDGTADTFDHTSLPTEE